MSPTTANRPLEERAKTQWDNDPEIRKEFLGDDGFERYLTYLKAEERLDRFAVAPW